MCPNNARNIDQNFTKIPILVGQRCEKNKMSPNAARQIDVKSAKCVQILRGISTKISQKGKFQGFKMLPKMIGIST